jgi:hypothetical protein
VIARLTTTACEGLSLREATVDENHPFAGWYDWNGPGVVLGRLALGRCLRRRA